MGAHSYLSQPVIAVNSHRAIAVSILVGLTLLLVGCGKGNGVDRLPVHGTVTLASGEKLSGSITFRPSDGLGPAANTKLEEGNYTFDRSNGPSAGPQIVTVMRVVPRSRVPDIKQAVPKNKKGVPKTPGVWSKPADVADDGQYVVNLTLD